MNIIKIPVILFVLSLLTAGVVSAQSYQAPEVISSTILSVNKTVQQPGNSNFVENLGANDATYQPGNTVQFQIIVKNTGTTTLSNIRVTDNFPRYMVNSTTNTSSASATINSLAPNQSQVVNFTGKIVDAGSLPQDQRVFCLVNQGAATVGNQISTDNAQFCVENPTVTDRVTTKGGLPVYEPPQVQTVPKTGPEAIALAALLPGGALGYFLRRKAK